METGGSDKSSKDLKTSKERSQNMSRIRRDDTKLERIVRSILHKAGFRFRKNVQDLPGKPDIVLPKYKTIIFIHGCFWHRHDCKKGKSVPATRTNFWISKFERNVERDKENVEELEKIGWNVVIVWECFIKNLDILEFVQSKIGNSKNG